MKRRDFLRLTTGVAASVAAGVPGASAGGRKVKVGQIGTGHAHASGKMAAARKLRDDYEVVGVVESDGALREGAAKNRVYEDLPWMSEEELLNTQGLEAVLVETTVPDLAPVAARCIDAGVHVHLDKPAGRSLSAFRKVLDEATRKNLTVQMGYMYRHNPGFRFAFQAVREGWLGDVFSVHGVMSKKVDDNRRKQLAAQPGGSMFELGCHLIDAMVAAIGAPGEVTPYTRRTRPEKDDLADNQLAVFEYPRATATIRSALVEVDGFARRQFVVCGNEGTVDIRPLEAPKLKLALEKPMGGYKKGYQDVSLPAMPGRYDEHLVELARIVRGEKEAEYGPAHDLAVHKAILEASGLPAFVETSDAVEAL